MESVQLLVPGPPRYARHRPEDTLLYRLVEGHWPDFLAALPGQRPAVQESGGVGEIRERVNGPAGLG